MKKKVAISQSNYIPWKGYFDLINMVDEFILYDDAQFTKNDWRNRNKIKTGQGINWLTIPVKHSISQKINEIEVLNNNWRKTHWKTLQQNYSKAAHFKEYFDIFEELYLKDDDIFLSRINYNFICAINKILGIQTKITWSSDYELIGDTVGKLINLCKQADATTYISGPAAKNYINETIFAQEKINLTYIDYSNYPEYNQLYSTFANNVSIVDLIFNEGNQAYKFLKSF